MQSGTTITAKINQGITPRPYRLALAIELVSEARGTTGGDDGQRTRRSGARFEPSNRLHAVQVTVTRGSADVPHGADVRGAPLETLVARYSNQPRHGHV
jgi:hypothetical protein